MGNSKEHTFGFGSENIDLFVVKIISEEVDKSTGSAPIMQLVFLIPAGVTTMAGQNTLPIKGKGKNISGNIEINVTKSTLFNVLFAR